MRGGAANARRCSAATPATSTPTAMSSQKWLPVAMTLNQTQAGQASQSAFAHGRRTTSAIVTPTISASAECRLGIAAYGFDETATAALEWLIVECSASVSWKPAPGNIRGGAVGTST